MAKNIIIAGALLCLFLSEVTFGQVQVKSTDMKQALVFRPNQDAIRGKLAEIREDYIVVLSSEREVRVPFAEIGRIILTVEQGLGRGPFYGAVLAGYGSAYVLAASRDHGGFVESRDLPWYAIVVVPSIALGAGIGYLVDPGSVQKDEVFDFTGTDEAKAREKSRLARAANQGLRESKLHFTFQASHVNSNVLSMLPSSLGYHQDNGAGQFNLLRKVQLTSSVAPKVELGVAWVEFSEPSTSAYAFEIPSNGDFKSYSVSETFQASGEFIVASYKPLYSLVDSWLDLKVGGGFGIASIDYNRRTTVSANTWQQSFFNVADNSVVAYLCGELEFELVDGFSIGLVADKVFGPSRDAPAVPEAKIPAQTLSFDNSSVGFTIGLHF